MIEKEQEFKLVPLTEVTPVENPLIDNCLSPSLYEFKAMYKNQKGEVGKITVNIYGKLRTKWEQCINKHKEQEITMPLILQDNKFYAGQSILENSR